MSVEIVTFGCRLNAFESEVIAREAERAGLTDAIVVNSCAVTNEAVAQARQSIRRLKRERPGLRIVVTGCAAQTQPLMFAEMAEVDRVVGNDDKMRGEAWRNARAAFDASQAFGIAGEEKIAVADIMAVREMAPHLLEGYQSGLPRVFVLTGVDLTSYGADLPGTPKLGQLTKQILRHVPELKRLRISSIDQVEVDRYLLDVIAGDERLMPHLHLSLQSGDDLILKRMKRRHSRRQAVQFCAQVRRLRPGIALGADIIAGFPTETEEMFKRSLDLVEECDLTFLHVFPYSPRPGAPAARMPQVGGDKIRERAKRLRMAGEAALQRRLTSETGATRQVLIVFAGQGRTEHFLPVAIADETPGAVRALTITGNDGARLTV